MQNIKVVDNVLDDDLTKRVYELSCSLPFKFGWSDGHYDSYWNHNIFGSHKGYPSINEIENPIYQEVNEVIKQKFGIDTNADRIYINCINYGSESHPHIDCVSGTTFIFYLCPMWNVHWGGETAFFTGEFNEDFMHPVFYETEIIKSVLPKRNRVVIFDGNIMHSVRPLSKTFKGNRLTLMYKYENCKINIFDNNG